MRWKKIVSTVSIVGFLLSSQLNAQTPIDVAEGILKVGIMSDGFLYFGFAAGDKMIFNFEEANGKELKEIEISEFDFGILHLESKTKKITNKTIVVANTGICKFRFSNTSILPKNCKYKIQRIPESPATQNFNTTVYTDLISDTTYVDVIEDILERVDTVCISFQDRVLRVNPASTAGGNKTSFSFLLPDNILGWSYYISTSKEGVQTYIDANKNMIATSGGIASRYQNYNILGAMVLKRPAEIPKLSTGANINYWIMDADNVALFSSGSQFKFIKNGKVINDYARMEPYKENLNFGFLNDHSTEALNVTVKITSVQAREVWTKKESKRRRITQSNKMHLKN
jgi:hypothetical protein